VVGGVIGGKMAGGVEEIGKSFDDRIEGNADVLFKEMIEAPICSGIFAEDGNIAAGKEKGFGDEFNIGRDGLARRKIEKIVDRESGEGIGVFLERLKAEARIDGITAGREAGFGASEFFEGLIVDEEAESALRRVALWRADAEIHGGGFAGAIGGFEGMEIEFEVVGMRENDAGSGRGLVAHIGRLRSDGQRIRNDAEQAGETIAGGKGDVGVAVGQGYILGG